MSRKKATKKIKKLSINVIKFMHEQMESLEDFEEAEELFQHVVFMSTAEYFILLKRMNINKSINNEVYEHLKDEIWSIKENINALSDEDFKKKFH